MSRYFIFICLFIISFIFGTTVSGIIKNSSNGKSIPNANIYIIEKEEGTVSDPYGYYKIDLSDGSYTINITNIGFKTYSSVININDGDIELNVNMDPAILEFGEISVEGLFSTRLGYESADVISKNVFELKEVELLFENFILVKLYTDGKGEKYSINRNLEIDRFGTAALPYYVILTPDDNLISTFPGMDVNPNNFIQFLENAKSEYYD